MSRGQGRVYQRKVGDRDVDTLWLDYSINGKRYRESAGTTSRKEANKILREKINDREAGKLTGRPERVTLADLRDGLKAHYTVQGNRSWKRAAQAFAHLEEFFGETCKVVNLDDATVGKYQEHRLTVDHAARNSVKYETGVLNAAFKVSQKRLGRAVAFKKGIKGVYCPARTHRR